MTTGKREATEDRSRNNQVTNNYKHLACLSQTKNVSITDQMDCNNILIRVFFSERNTAHGGYGNVDQPQNQIEADQLADCSQGLAGLLPFLDGDGTY